MLQYSDSEPVAKIDSELKTAQDELSELVKSKHDYQEQLEKQNSKLYIIKTRFDWRFKNYCSMYAVGFNISLINLTLSMVKRMMLSRVRRHRTT